MGLKGVAQKNSAKIIYHLQAKGRYCWCRKTENIDSKHIHQVVDGKKFRELEETDANICIKCAKNLEAGFQPGEVSARTERNYTHSIDVCLWAPDPQHPAAPTAGAYVTSCNQSFTLMDMGNLKAHGMKFCCFCGKKLREVKEL